MKTLFKQTLKSLRTYIFAFACLCAAPLPLFAEVYLCFPFFNELDILEIHLEELYDHVDHFVIVESCETFTGHHKPFYFEENKERYSRFLDKVIHVKLEEHQETTNPWVREYFQRDQIARGLKECAPDDLIILCDCDEILRPSALKAGLARHDLRSYTIFEQDLYKFFLNRKEPEKWQGPIMLTYHNLCQYCLTDVRRMRLSGGHLGSLKQLAQQNMQLHTIKNGGWHFTSMGGKEAVLKKLNSWSHSYDSDIQEFLNNFPEEYQKALDQTERVTLDSSFPRYVLENKALMYQKGFIDE